MMRGTSDLPTLLATLAPAVSPDVYVFLSCTHAKYGDRADLKPIAAFCESEGLTLIVPKEHADATGQDYDGEYSLVSLGVHSDLQAVGLTAAIASVLSDRGIAANIVAAFYHDHIFVPLSRVDDAVAALLQLAADNQA